MKGIHTSGSIYTKDYTQVTDFDNDSINLGAEIRDQVGRWNLAYVLQLSRSTFSSQDFLATTGLGFNLKTRLDKKSVLGIKILHENISDRSSEYFYLDGNRTRLKIEYRKKTKPSELRYGYELELNDRADTSTLSYSPTRHKLSVEYRKQISKTTRIGGSLEYRHSDYRRVSTQNRSDNRIRGKLKGEYKLDPTWRSKTELLHANNRSNESEFEYHKYQVMISVNALF